MPVSAGPRIGSELLGYRVEELLGRGGMGVVYRAYDVALERSVALKLLAPSLAQDRDFRERFLVETRLAAALEHPNVVPIHDAGEADGQLYLAMRYVEGTDLKGLLQAEGPLEPARAIAICAQVAEALDAAHARGLVHRDVKPSNVLLDEHEHAYLADFGLTRRLTEQAPGFEAGLSLGTPAYVAPEQIKGKEVDGRVDQYSLACLLCECLTGSPPFPRASDAATLFAHLEEAPSAPSGLEGVMPKALAKDPGERYDTCAAFIADARRVLGLERERSRWPLAVAGIGAALIGAALLAFFLTRGDGAVQPTTSGRLVRIDPATNEVEKTIAVGNGPSAVAVDESGVWVANHDDGTVWRVDPEDNRITLKASAHGTPADIALGLGRAFVSNGPQDANISTIFTDIGGQENVINLASGGGLLGSARLAAGASGVWIAAADRRVGSFIGDRGFVSRDVVPQPRDERAVAFASGVAVGKRAAWVIGDPNDPTLWRIDTATGRRVATLPLPFAPKDVAVGAGGVWITSQLDDTVSRIDPATNRITATIPVGRGAAGVAVGAGVVWVANAIDGTVSRIDPRALRVVQTIDVDGMPDDVAVGDDSVWVTARADPDVGGAREEDELRIGVLAACEGGFGFAYEASLAGAELPLLQRRAKLAGRKPLDGLEGGTVAGKNVRVFFGCGDASSEKALSEARRLVEAVGVDVLIGPTQLSESFAIKNYARRHPEVTVVNGTAAGQAVTLRNPAPNFFNFSTDGAQWMAGLGRYAYEELGWRNVATVATTLDFNYTQVAGFVAEFCALGGNVAKRIWVPPEPKDLTPYLAQVPRKGVDGFLMAASSAATTAPFVEGLPQLRGNLARKIVGGVLLPASQDALGKRLEGVVYADAVPAFFGVPIPAGARPWASYVAEFAKAFPSQACCGPFIFAVAYRNSMEAVLEAFEKVGGDLSGGQRRFRDALAHVELDAPNGRFRLDGNRQAIGPTYLSRIGKPVQGQYSARTFRTIPNVEQTFGGYFRRNGPMPSRTYPPCKKGNPPPWAVKR